MSRIPLALQVGLAILLILGVALGAGIYPALRLEAAQLEKEREKGWSNLALAATLAVAARARGEVDDASYRASVERLLSVKQLKEQLLAFSVESSRPDLVFSWAPTRPLAEEKAAGSREVRVLVKGEGREDLAVITLRFDQSAVKAQMTRLQHRQAWALALGLLLVLAASVLLIAQISRPVGRLIAAMDTMARGSYDVTVTPSGAREIRRLTEAFNRMAADLKDTERLKRELAAARAVQAYLLPKAPPSLEGYRLEGLCVPAAEVGGDFYQYYLDQGGAISLVIGDVSGKGMKAAMLTSLILGALQTIVRQVREPGEVLRRLNEVLYSEIQDRSFATVLFGSLAPASGELSFANAGHLYPFHFDASSGAWRELPAGDTCLPAGISGEEHFSTVRLSLGVGDRLLLMSDGIVEAKSPSGELFGYDRLRGVLEGLGPTPGDGLIQSITNAISSFVGQAPQADDLTAVLICRDSSPTP